MATIDDLMAIKRNVEANKEKKARLEGKLSSLMERLEKEFGCKSLKDAEKKLKELNSEMERMEKELTKGVEDIQEKYL